MQIRVIYVTLYFCLIVMIFPFGEGLGSEVDPYPNIEVPIMPGGHKIRKVIDQPNGTKSVNYYVGVEYPADEVVRFYDSSFKEMGWVQSDEKMKRQWECFIDGTINGNPKVRQLLSLWINSELKAEAFLALRYVKYERDWGQELYVLCQIQPMFDKTELNRFFKKIDKSGNYVEFMELLDAYRDKNGEINIDKAIRQNKDNIYLREYKRIIGEIINGGKNGVTH